MFLRRTDVEICVNPVLMFSMRTVELRNAQGLVFKLHRVLGEVQETIIKENTNARCLANKDDIISS